MPDQQRQEIVVTGKRKHGGDTVSIVVNDQQISGWQSVRITRGCERVPAEFELKLTEKFENPATVVVMPGAPVVVKIGYDTVITGYCDRYIPSIDSDNHSVQIVGRGKCQDLVDCSAEWPGGQISMSTLLGIATKLASPYGITVSQGKSVTAMKPIPRFQLSFGETPMAIIERIARYEGVLAYENVYGNLMLDIAGSTAAASALVLGQNVEAATATYTLDQRYSEIRVMRQSMERAGDTGTGGNLLTSAYDKSVRHRRLDIVCEAGQGGYEVGLQRANWEMARRYGRSFLLHVTTDSWRDSSETLWTPNTLVDIKIPALKLMASKWIISEVTYRRGNDGTHCDLVIMPPEAFQPEPILLAPTFGGVPFGGAQRQ